MTLTPAATAEVPTHQLAVCRELVDDYGVDGLELDWTCDQNFFDPASLADGSAAAATTAFLRAAAAVARAAPGRRPALVGARVYQQEAVNAAQGMPVRAWLEEGLLDFVVPLMYADNQVRLPLPRAVFSHNMQLCMRFV